MTGDFNGHSLDARPLNWRFVLPDSETAGQLLLATENETLPGAISVSLAAAKQNPEGVGAFLDAAMTEGPYPNVVVSDLTGWSKALKTDPAVLLTRLAKAVRPGGTLFAGFGNKHYPTEPFAAGTMSLKQASEVLGKGGFTVAKQYVAMPDQRCPALLVPVSRSGAELAYVLRNIMFPYTDSTSALKGRLKQLLLTVMQRGALLAPPTLRFRLAPAYAVVAVRPTDAAGALPPALSAAATS
jgi:hypothetical protein